MLVSLLVAWLALTACALPSSMTGLVSRGGKGEKRRIAPKVVVVSMFGPERAVWIEPFKLTNNVTTPGLSPLFPYVACDAAYDVCIVTTGEAEINAASTTMALLLSHKFDFRKTYFLIAGIAGVNPYEGTLGSAMFARFAVQVALQYELDARQMPSNFTTGYWAFGTPGPGIKPKELYGTEIFELNTNLLARVASLTKDVKLNDSATAIAYRARFDYAPANLPPSVLYSCDTATSDVYYAGSLLSESFGNVTSLLSDGKARYCSTQQEDNATLESMVRMAKAGLMDYSRVMILRTGSDFDRAPPQGASGGLTAYQAFIADQGGFAPALQNLVLAGRPVVKAIVGNWKKDWEAGVAPQSTMNGSFYGDDLGTLRNGVSMA